uniref:Pectinesterase inhibitor domain-containing protein n=1 Tax=Salix viminalis TaxID=40686 RepID=A0A6N2LUH1_SALVM
MTFSRCFSLFAPLLAIILLTNPALSEARDSQDLIDEVCRQMEDYGFCNRVFHENMESPEIDHVGLAAIAMEQTITNATSTHEYISDLLRRTTEKSLRNVLVACENAFGIVESSFGAAMQSFHRKEYEDMLKLEHVAPRAQASCETSFTAPPSPPNPLAERNREMRILITMAIVSGKAILKL